MCIRCLVVCVFCSRQFVVERGRTAPLYVSSAIFEYGVCVQLRLPLQDFRFTEYVFTEHDVCQGERGSTSLATRANVKTNCLSRVVTTFASSANSGTRRIVCGVRVLIVCHGGSLPFWNVLLRASTNGRLRATSSASHIAVRILLSTLCRPKLKGFS